MSSSQVRRPAWPRRSLASSTAPSADAGSSRASGRPRMPPRHQRPAASRSTSSHNPCSTASALLGPAAQPMLSRNGGFMRARAGPRRRQTSAGSSIFVSSSSAVAARHSNLAPSPPSVPCSRSSRNLPSLSSCGLPHLRAAACRERLVARFELREILDALADARLEGGAHRQAHAPHSRQRRAVMIGCNHARGDLAAEEHETWRFRRAQLEDARELRRRPQQRRAVGGELRRAGLGIVFQRLQQPRHIVLGRGALVRVCQAIGGPRERLSERLSGRAPCGRGHPRSDLARSSVGTW